MQATKRVEVSCIKKRPVRESGFGKTSTYYIQAVVIILLVASCSCAGCGSKQKSEYTSNGITVDFNGQPYVIANIQGTIVSVKQKPEVTEIIIRLKVLEFGQKVGEDNPSSDYRDREITVEMQGAPQGLEQGKAIDARVRIVHTAENLKFLGMSAKIT
jgi:hypothetical protein